LPLGWRGSITVKVVHVITGLRVGGAETMLLKLLSRFQEAGGPEGAVISLSVTGPLADPISALGVPVTSMGMSAGFGAFFKLPRLRAAINEARPDIVQTWMYHANLMGALALRGPHRPPLIWGLRQADLDPRLSKRRTALVARAGARLSASVPSRIVCVSESARDYHIAMGYDATKMVVIPNGFDFDVFRRGRLRLVWRGRRDIQWGARRDDRRGGSAPAVAAFGLPQRYPSPHRGARRGGVVICVRGGILKCAG
jgi:glycosyltransferase involved in cell wall biosynthesis